MQTCKLCNENRELRESHIIPRFLYRYMIKVADNNLTQFSGALNLWQRSNRQLTKNCFALIVSSVWVVTKRNSQMYLER